MVVPGRRGRMFLIETIYHAMNTVRIYSRIESQTSRDESIKENHGPYLDL